MTVCGDWFTFLANHRKQEQEELPKWIWWHDFVCVCVWFLGQIRDAAQSSTDGWWKPRLQNGPEWKKGSNESQTDHL